VGSEIQDGWVGGLSHFPEVPQLCPLLLLEEEGLSVLRVWMVSPWRYRARQLCFGPIEGACCMVIRHGEGAAGVWVFGVEIMTESEAREQELPGE
jgi:hypothetical protein